MDADFTATGITPRSSRPVEDGLCVRGPGTVGSNAAAGPDVDTHVAPEVPWLAEGANEHPGWGDRGHAEGGAQEGRCTCGGRSVEGIKRAPTGSTRGPLPSTQSVQERFAGTEHRVVQGKSTQSVDTRTYKSYEQSPDGVQSRSGCERRRHPETSGGTSLRSV